ncbi:hypothetical protein, partial [Arthrobacter sp. DR-2P]
EHPDPRRSRASRGRRRRRRTSRRRRDQALRPPRRPADRHPAAGRAVLPAERQHGHPRAAADRRGLRRKRGQRSPRPVHVLPGRRHRRARDRPVERLHRPPCRAAAGPGHHGRRHHPLHRRAHPAAARHRPVPAGRLQRRVRARLHRAQREPAGQGLRHLRGHHRRHQRRDRRRGRLRGRAHGRDPRLPVHLRRRPRPHRHRRSLHLPPGARRTPWWGARRHGLVGRRLPLAVPGVPDVLRVRRFGCRLDLAHRPGPAGRHRFVLCGILGHREAPQPPAHRRAPPALPPGVAGHRHHRPHPRRHLRGHQLHRGAAEPGSRRRLRAFRLHLGFAVPHPRRADWRLRRAFGGVVGGPARVGAHPAAGDFAEPGVCCGCCGVFHFACCRVCCRCLPGHLLQRLLPDRHQRALGAVVAEGGPGGAARHQRCVVRDRGEPRRRTRGAVRRFGYFCRLRHRALDLGGHHRRRVHRQPLRRRPQGRDGL